MNTLFLYKHVNKYSFNFSIETSKCKIVVHSNNQLNWIQFLSNNADFPCVQRYEDCVELLLKHGARVDVEARMCWPGPHNQNCEERGKHRE